MLGVSESMLRFWEKEIPMIKPKTTGQQYPTVYGTGHREHQGGVQPGEGAWLQACRRPQDAEGTEECRKLRHQGAGDAHKAARPAAGDEKAVRLPYVMTDLTQNGH